MSEWLKNTVEILATGGTLWAAISARKSAQTSAKQLESQIKDQEKLERPRLVPLNKEILVEIPHPLVDWSTNKENELNIIKGKSRYSEFTVPIINTGKSFAINTKYCYEIEGGIHAIDSKSYKDHSIIGPDPDELMLESEHFHFRVSAKDLRPSYNKWYLFMAEVIPYLNSVPIVQSNSIEQLQIPSYFVALSNIYLLNFWHKEDSELIQPKLILTIYYKDQYNNEHMDKFRMQLGNQINHKNSKVRAWIEFEQIEFSES